MCGTAEFLAPEVVNYDFVSAPTDMWAVGVITYILLSGYSPFLGDNELETFNNITSCSYDFDVEEFENISEEAKSFICKLLLKNPLERLTVEQAGWLSESDVSSYLSLFQTLSHPWLRLTDTVDAVEAAVIKTENLRRYLARRRWMRCGQIIKAANRLAGEKQVKSWRLKCADCAGKILKSPETPGLDHNGNKPGDSQESLLERRLREEFRGNERVNVKKKNIDDRDRLDSK